MVILPQIGPMLAANFPTTSVNALNVLKRETTSFVFTEIKPSRVLKLLSKLDVAKATGLDMQ